MHCGNARMIIFQHKKRYMLNRAEHLCHRKRITVLLLTHTVSFRVKRHDHSVALTNQQWWNSYSKEEKEQKDENPYPFSFELNHLWDSQIHSNTNLCFRLRQLRTRTRSISIPMFVFLSGSLTSFSTPVVASKLEGWRSIWSWRSHWVRWTESDIFETDNTTIWLESNHFPTRSNMLSLAG